MRTLLVCVLLTAPALMAQSQEFEAVSVKANKTLSNSSSTHGDKSQFRATNVSLRNLIMRAYGMKDYQVEAPDWLRTERFDVAAKYPSDIPKSTEGFVAASQVMMQKMLQDEFKLAVHHETKNLPVYALVIGKSGIKFKEVPDRGSHNQDNSNMHYTGSCVTMTAFADFLARRMELPVLDETGLKGYYDLTLEWVPEPRQPGDGRGDAPIETDLPKGAPLPIAIEEQLGLRLQTRKAPLDVLVVDHAERVAVEN